QGLTASARRSCSARSHCLGTSFVQCKVSLPGSQLCDGDRARSRREGRAAGAGRERADRGGAAPGPRGPGDGGLVVADADKGLLKVRPDKTVEMLTDAAEGLKFALTDGVDIAADGTIYFTDASYKYSLADHFLDVLEARPHGRLMSFDPSTRRTSVLARDLYFANGVAVAPDQDSLIFCETVM
uniref:Strictosidine synthase conserved region domain-containing protein n=1 Tax=Aegilops tauschii subsp. strangulata TaxID=200361 RepID=A0A452YSN8_AEGTS